MPCWQNSKISKKFIVVSTATNPIFDHRLGYMNNPDPFMIDPNHDAKIKVQTVIYSLFFYF